MTGKIIALVQTNNTKSDVNSHVLIVCIYHENPPHTGGHCSCKAITPLNNKVWLCDKELLYWYVCVRACERVCDRAFVVRTCVVRACLSCRHLDN